MVAQRQSSVASQRESSLHDGSESLMHERGCWRLSRIARLCQSSLKRGCWRRVLSNAQQSDSHGQRARISSCVYSLHLHINDEHARATFVFVIPCSSGSRRLLVGIKSGVCRAWPPSRMPSLSRESRHQRFPHDAPRIVTLHLGQGRDVSI